MARAVVIEEDGTARTIPHLIVEALLPEAAPEDRAWVLERHRPYPPHALVEPGRLSAFKALGLPTGYVLTTRDLAVPPQLGRTFAARLTGSHYAEVDAGHDLMITRPEETADALLSVLR